MIFTCGNNNVCFQHKVFYKIAISFSASDKCVFGYDIVDNSQKQNNKLNKRCSTSNLSLKFIIYNIRKYDITISITRNLKYIKSEIDTLCIVLFATKDI
jgi:hypothetical protein